VLDDRAGDGRLVVALEVAPAARARHLVRHPRIVELRSIVDD
jgi:hypothetical protein